MKTLFLTVIVSVCCLSQQVFSQELLWRQGRNFSQHPVSNFESNNHPAGLYFNGEYMYFLQSHTEIALYNPQTLVESKKQITNVGRIIQVSPHCKLVLIEHPDSMVLYDFRHGKNLYSVKGKHSVISFSRDSRYTLFSNGDIIDWNDTLVSSPIIMPRKVDNVDKYALMSANSKLLMWGTSDSLRIYDIQSNSNTWIPYSFADNSQFRFSPNGSTILNFSPSFITSITTLDSKIYTRKGKFDNNYDYEFIDDNHYMALRNIGNQSVLYKQAVNDTTANFQRMKPEINGSNYPPSFIVTDDRLTKGNSILFSRSNDDCGGMPTFSNVIFHVIDTLYSTVKTIPDNSLYCMRAGCFMDGDSLLVSLTCRGTLIQTNVENGAVVKEWQLPKSIFTDTLFFINGFHIYTEVLSSGDYVHFNAGKKMYRFSTQQGTITDSMMVGDTSVTFLTYSSDKKYILAVSGDKVAIAENTNFSYIKTITAESRLFQVSMINDSISCSVAGDGKILTYSFSQGTRLGTMLLKGKSIHLSLSGSSYAVDQLPNIFMQKMPGLLKYNKNNIFGIASINSYFIRIKNHDNLWGIMNIPFQIDDSKNTYVNLVSIHKDSIVLVKKLTNGFSCQTDNLIVSNNQKYVLAIGGFRTAFDMYAFDSIKTSVDDDITQWTENPNNGFLVHTTAFSLQQSERVESCEVFSAMGESQGLAHITSEEGKVFVELPQGLVNGMYMLHFRTDTSTRTQCIILMK
jgi:hypothetical protein